MLFVRVSGADQLRRNLGSIARNFDNFSKVFEKIADDFRRTQSAVFRSQGAFEGRAGWSPLRPSTVMRKGSSTILVEKGALKTSFTKKGGAHISQITNDRVILGSADPKGKFHQSGTSRMVARPPLTASNTTNRRWVRIAHKEIMKDIRTGLVQFEQ